MITCCIGVSVAVVVVAAATAALAIHAIYSVKTENKFTKPENFHNFIERVVNKFKKQRDKENPNYKFEFAVLFVSPEKDLSKVCSEMKFKNTVQPFTYTDSACPTFPKSENMVNYITASPSGKKGKDHAEAKLMSKLHTLLAKCGAYQTLILYTWLLPCGYCKGKIVHGLKDIAKDKQVILVYTSTMSSMKDKKKEKIIDALETEKIHVIREYIHKQL